MLNRLYILSLLIFLTISRNAGAQTSRSLNTSFIGQEAPVTFNAYKATLWTFEEGFMAVEYLEEVISLENVAEDRIKAFEIGIVYIDAFGDEIDRVRETRINEIVHDKPLEYSFRSPMLYNIPVYSAVAEDISLGDIPMSSSLNTLLR